MQTISTHARMCGCIAQISIEQFTCMHITHLDTTDSVDSVDSAIP